MCSSALAEGETHFIFIAKPSCFYVCIDLSQKGSPIRKPSSCSSEHLSIPAGKLLALEIADLSSQTPRLHTAHFKQWPGWSQPRETAGASVREHQWAYLISLIKHKQAAVCREGGWAGVTKLITRNQSGNPSEWAKTIPEGQQIIVSFTVTRNVKADNQCGIITLILIFYSCFIHH